jgi:mono/diheme cytochrome c family protein
MQLKLNVNIAVLLLVAGTLEGFIGFASAQQMEVIVGGELEYQRNCAVCHGTEGRGDGIMRRYLTLPPANLRQLAKNNGGKFPFWEVYRKIDGQTEVRTHGTREMPIWGDRFRAEAGSDRKVRSNTGGRPNSQPHFLSGAYPRMITPAGGAFDGVYRRSTTTSPSVLTFLNASAGAAHRARC